MSVARRAPVLAINELSALLLDLFPQAMDVARIEALSTHCAILRVFVNDSHLRPGGTVSGPTLFMAADVAFYAAVLGMIGPKPLAVTASLSINFLRRPAPADLIAEARIQKLGRRLASGDVLIYSDGNPDPVAQAITTYALPE